MGGIFVAGCLLCGTALAQLQIDATWSGSYYNPEQSGHGFFIEILPNEQAWVAWFVFDNSGEPYWLTGIGDIVEDRIDVAATLTQGGQFPPAF